MSDEDPDNGGLEAGLRWLAQQVTQSVEHLEQLDVNGIARAAGIDPDRARHYLDSAGQWLSEQVVSFNQEAGSRFSEFADAMAAAAAAAGARETGADESMGAKDGPHPLDVPTDAQGLALSAVDSGRWRIEPGSHVINGGDGPAPASGDGLVGELRARDWINASGQVTLMGQNALKRWIAAQGDD